MAEIEGIIDSRNGAEYHDKTEMEDERSRSRSGDRSRSRSYSKSRSRSRSKRARSRSKSGRRSSSRSRSRSRRRNRSHSPFSQRRRHRGHRDDPEPNRCLGVFGLSLETRERDVEDLFSKYGKVAKCQLVYDRHSGRSRGFAFIHFEEIDDAIEAKENCAGKDLDGKEIRVDFSVTVRAHTPTPGVYLGHPTDSRQSRGRGYGYSRYESRNDSRYEPRYDRRRRSPSPYGFRRSPHYSRRSRSPYYSRRSRSPRYSRRSRSPYRRSRSRSPFQRRY